MVRISNGYRYFTTLPFVIANIMKASSHSPQTAPQQEQPSQSAVAVESEFFLYDDKNWLIKKLEPKSSLASQLPSSGNFYLKACRGDVCIQSGLFGEWSFLYFFFVFCFSFCYCYILCYFLIFNKSFESFQMRSLFGEWAVLVFSSFLCCF